MFKRLVAAMLFVASFVCLLTPVYAVENTVTTIESDNFNYENGSETLSAVQAELYTQYEVNVPNMLVAVKPFVMSISTTTNSYTIGSHTVTIFQSNALHQYLYHCQEIEEISLIDENLNISYVTAEGIKVYLCYDNIHLLNKVVYFPDTDTAVIDSGATVTQSQHFLTAQSCEVSESQFQDCEVNLRDGSSDVSDITEDVCSTSSTASYGFTSEAAMLADLKKAFPVQENQTIYTTSLYSYPVDSYLEVKVTQTRNTYVKKSADYRSFLASTAVTLIASYLSLPTTVAVTILTALGIGISAAQLVVDDITLYRSATYQFIGSRDGYVYDPISYQKFVHVVFHSNSGVFTGGYASDGTFTWVMSSVPAAYDYEPASIAQDAIGKYTQNILLDGYCSMYYPD